MNQRERTRENAARRAELRLVYSHTDPEAVFHKEHNRLTEILRFLRRVAVTTRETAIAARQKSADLRQLLLNPTEEQLRPFQWLKPRVKAVRHAQSADERSSASALPAATAHEINNPLEAITSLIYLLENEGTRTDKGGEYLALIKGEVGRVAEIAQQALAKHRQTPVLEIVNVGEVIESVLDLYRSKFEAKGIVIIREHDFRGSIRAHPRQIREVFANLFLNAIDAMSRGGRLRIRISEAREWNGQQRYGVRILVADNGRGVAPDHVSKIFEPFFTTKGERGTGMGLSIVKEMVRSHRGTVRVRSGVRKGRSGTIFSIFLPGETRSQLAAA
jgi:signal transduction histidine kinase